MKVSELNGVELDAWVARALGWVECPYDDDLWKVSEIQSEFKSTWKPSAYWAMGGPIIESEKIDLSFQHEDRAWKSYINGDDDDFYGRDASPLVAAMRAFVASKFGDEVP